MRLDAERLALLDGDGATCGACSVVEMTPGLPTFVGNDMTALMGTARANLGLYTTLPFSCISSTSAASLRRLSRPDRVQARSP
jgi:hypothetical protein